MCRLVIPGEDVGHGQTTHTDLMSLLRRILLSWLADAIVLAVAAGLLTEVTVRNAGDLIVAALLFGILNTFLKPLVRLITLPLAVITLGVAWFFVSMLMLWITQAIVSGFAIHGFWTLVWTTIIVWAVDIVINVAFGMFRVETTS
jgi:putative membrane protein